MTFAMMLKLIRLFSCSKASLLNTKPLALMKTPDKTLKRIAFEHPGSAFNCSMWRFLTHLPNHAQKNSGEAYKYHQSLKCLKYEQQLLEVENNNFGHLVSSWVRGRGPPNILLRNNLHTHKNKFCSSAHRYHVPQNVRCFKMADQNW